MEKNTTKKARMGLFVACYKIGGNRLGAPLFDLHLCVNAPAGTVTGSGRITQAVSPPLDLTANMSGDFSYMTVMPRNVHILVVATGYPAAPLLHAGGAGPAFPANVNLRMVLSEDWKVGVANFKYIDSKGAWHEVENAPVKFAPCNSLS